MSYLTLENGIPNFSKAVISLWFRVPSHSIARARSVTEFTNVLPKTIPLLTFGDGPTIIDWEPNAIDVVRPMNYAGGGPVIMSPTTFMNVGTYPISPCYIGVDCRNPVPTLTFNLQTSTFAVFSDTFHSLTRMESWDLLALPPPDVTNPAPGNGWQYLTMGLYIGYAAGFVDLSNVGNSRGEYFIIETPKPGIAPDQWHHVLLSFDLSEGCATHARPDVDPPQTIADVTSQFCKLWYAIDDVNYDGEGSMGRFAVEGGNKNAILSDNAWHVANSFNRLVYNTSFPAGRCSFGSALIPSSRHEIGLPASAKFVNNVYQVELAELQIFTGVTLNTAVETNRRAFVHADGTPVIPEGTEDDPREPAEKLLGKKPDIQLHGSDNWKDGYNTGTTGIHIKPDGTTEKISDGQFNPTGGIEAYTPDPQLEHGAA